MPYVTRHGFGYSIFEYAEEGIVTELNLFVAVDEPVKFAGCVIANRSGRPRRLSVTSYWEWVLGEVRDKTLLHVVTELDPMTGALFARNAYSSEFGERIAFVDSSESVRTMTADRTEFLGRNGTPTNPAAMHRIRLSGRVGAGFDPCAAMQATVELEDGEEKDVVFILGAAQNAEQARQLVQRFRGAASAAAGPGGRVALLEPLARHRLLRNARPGRQLPGQRLARLSDAGLPNVGPHGLLPVGRCLRLSRPVARCHGTDPRRARRVPRAPACAPRPPVSGGGRAALVASAGGSRRPHALFRRLSLAALRDDPVTSPRPATRECWTSACRSSMAGALRPEEESYYDLPQFSADSGTLYEHCIRALDHGLRFGVHGLPLMGCGDWNDGMNLVGAQGRGESVWLAFFLYDALTRFAELAQNRGDSANADKYSIEAGRLRGNIEEHAWDGDWYRRAYFDDGTPLGSTSNPECQIDSLPQSWSVLSGAGTRERSLSAMNSVDRLLIRREARLIQLFEPPFDKSSLNPGYIKGYIPGVRENGGQYTHAAVWTAMAFAAMGDSQRAWELFSLINPMTHADTADGAATYCVEPYVVAADIYAVAPHTGAAGGPGTPALPVGCTG